jgi:hypothetical protein
MVEYLLAKKKAHDGYYLAQPYDVDKKTDPSGVRGFSAASLEATTKALVEVAKEKGCDVILGLDFGGDVAMPTKRTEMAGSSLAHEQRDALNLRAAIDASKQLGIKTVMVAVAPGVDAAAVAPHYRVAMEQPTGTRPEGSVLHITKREDGNVDLEPIRDASGLLLKTAPECKLIELPPHLFAKRINSEAEARFLDVLGGMYHDIMRDCPTREKRAKHAYKTYTLVVKMYDGTRLGHRAPHQQSPMSHPAPPATAGTSTSSAPASARTTTSSCWASTAARRRRAPTCTRPCRWCSTSRSSPTTSPPRRRPPPRAPAPPSRGVEARRGRRRRRRSRCS